MTPATTRRKSRRLRIALIAFVLFVIISTAAGSWIASTRPGARVIRRGGFVLHALLLPDGVKPMQSVQCIEPGHVQLISGNDGKTLQLRTFSIDPKGLTQLPMFEQEMSQQYGWPILAWIDGRGLMTNPGQIGSSGNYSIDLMLLSAEKDSSARKLAAYAFRSNAQQFGLVGEELIALVPTGFDKPPTSYQLVACLPGEKLTEMEQLKNVAALGTAWHGKSVVPAIINVDGEFLAYDPLSRKMSARPGFPKVVVGGTEQPFAGAENFLVLQSPAGEWEALGRDGSRTSLVGVDQFSQSPDGKSRDSQKSASVLSRLSPQRLWQPRKYDMYWGLKDITEVWASEGKLAPADCATNASELRLIDAHTIALIDPFYRRVVQIRQDRD